MLNELLWVLKLITQKLSFFPNYIMNCFVYKYWYNSERAQSDLLKIWSTVQNPQNIQFSSSYKTNKNIKSSHISCTFAWKTIKTTIWLVGSKIELSSAFALRHIRNKLEWTPPIEMRLTKHRSVRKPIFERGVVPHPAAVTISPQSCCC